MEISESKQLNEEKAKRKELARTRIFYFLVICCILMVIDIVISIVLLIFLPR